MKELILLTLIMLFLVIPSVAANYCIGDILMQEKNVSIDDDVITLESNQTCDLGCDNFLGKCIEPEMFMPMPFLILFEGMGIALLFITMIRRELIFPLVGMVLFFMLALSVFVTQGATAGLTLMALNIGFGLLSFAMFLIRTMLTMQDELVEKDRRLYENGEVF